MFNLIHDEIKGLYKCNFSTQYIKVDGYKTSTMSSKKYCTLIHKSEPIFKIGSDRYNNYRNEHIGNPVRVLTDCVEYDFVTDSIKGTASIQLIENYSTIKFSDYGTEDYSTKELAFNLKIQYPNVSDDIIECFQYFRTNPLPKGVVLEMNLSALDSILQGLRLVVPKIKLNLR